MSTTDTPFRYSLSALSRMHAPEIERITSDSFKTLTTLAVADATGTVQPDVAQWLRSDDVLHDWHDALLCAAGELRTSIERMQYLKDPRVEQVKRQASAVRRTRREAVHLLRECRAREVEREEEDYGLWDAVKFSHKILGSHFHDERERLEEEERQRRGLHTRRAPIDSDEMENRADLVESLYWHGILHTPVSAEIQELRDITFEEFREVVADDCRDQEDRNLYLRHPLALARWEEALNSLVTMTSESALAHPERHTMKSLPENFAQSHTHDEIMQILNARRFLHAVLQRKTEARRCWRRVLAYVHKPLLEHRRPWWEAGSAAQIRLAQAHPEEYAWIRGWVRAVIQNGQEGDDILRSIPSRVRGELKRNLVQGLADGTWRNAPPPTP